jgi:putative tryptophan/tyrosine transport system substrate-binding protein
MLTRRHLLAGASAAIAAPLGAQAQQAGKLYRIGFLQATAPSDLRFQRLFEAFRTALAKLGYVEGKNIAIEDRWAAGKYERLPDLAAELVRLRPDVIVTAAVPAIQAVKDATQTIPIVMAVVVDPVATGLVASLARPGGNITGLSLMTPDLVGKQLGMLKEIVSKVARVAVLWNPTNPGNAPQVKAAELAARALELRLRPFEVRNAHEIDEIDNAFVAMAREGTGALIVLGDVIITNQRERIAHLAARYRLPTVAGFVEYVKAGCLIGYSPSFLDSFRRAAGYVDKIVKGAKPADLPVEQPTKFDFVINLKTAKALGLSIPRAVLARADELLQ